MQGVGDGSPRSPSLMKRDLACHASPCTCDKRFWLVPASLGECNVHPLKDG